MPWFVAFLMLAGAFGLGQVALKYFDSVAAYRTFFTEEAFNAVEPAVRQYYYETGGYPASMAALASTPGYEHLKSLDQPNALGIATNVVGILRTTGLTDSAWTFDRAAIIARQDYLEGNETGGWQAYFSAAARNSCGGTAFSASSPWCGAKTLFWRRAETKTQAAEDFAIERRRQARTAAKMVQYFNRDLEFNSAATTPQCIIGSTATWPMDCPGSATALIEGSDVGNPTAGLKGALAIPVTISDCSATGTSAADSRTPNWRLIDNPSATPTSYTPLECSDLFSIWGTPVLYWYMNVSPNKGVMLISRSPYRDSGGNYIYVSTELVF